MTLVFLKILAQKYTNKAFLVKNIQIRHFSPKFRHFCFSTKFWNQTNLRVLISNMTKFYPKNIQIRLFWSQIQALLSFAKVLQLDKFEGPDFKYDNVVFKFQPKNTKNTVSIFEYVIKQYFLQNISSSNLEPKMSSLYTFGLYV